MNKAVIEPNTRSLLQYCGEEVLTRTIWSLSPEQKSSEKFREIGIERYLSALRSGGIDNAEMTRTAFKLDPYFLKSKLVTEAAKAGFYSKIARKQFDAAAKIKAVMGLSDEIPSPVDGSKTESAGDARADAQ